MYTEAQLRKFRSHIDSAHDIPEEEIMEIIGSCGAVWTHDGNPASPHAELTTGLCSNGYFDLSRVAFDYPNIWVILAVQLYKKIKFLTVDRVVGSAYSGITLSFLIADLFGIKHGFTQKDISDPKGGNKMIWKGPKINPEETILQVEELITTRKTLFNVRGAIKQSNPKVAFSKTVACLVHRPPKLIPAYNDVNIISLIEKEVWAVNSEECPLCKLGSKRLRPEEHWSELTGKK